MYILYSPFVVVKAQTTCFLRVSMPTLSSTRVPRYHFYRHTSSINGVHVIWGFEIWWFLPVQDLWIPLSVAVVLKWASNGVWLFGVQGSSSAMHWPSGVQRSSGGAVVWSVRPDTGIVRMSVSSTHSSMETYVTFKYYLSKKESGLGHGIHA
jgi:hypothetical protein